MEHPYIHVKRHWEQSQGIARSAVVFSELPRGGSPIVTGTRAINFVLEGTERYEVGERSYVVRPGEFLFVDAGVSARATLPDAGTTRGLCVYLPPMGGEAEQSDPAIENVFQMSTRATRFGRILERAGQALGQDGALSPAAVATLIREAQLEFDVLHSNLSLELTRIDAIKPSTRQDLLQRLHRARAYLHDHVDRTIPLPRLAAVAGMSQFHLARSFRAVFGSPPGQYHAELRIRLADGALREGAMSIIEAAQRFGFAEASSFSRAFVRIAGITPGQAARNRPAQLECAAGAAA